MAEPTFPNIKLGVLGGGQLGKMLAEAAHPWHQNIHVLDQSADFPAGGVATTFTEGDFTNYDDVLAFGEKMDLITIEIEKVNVEALYELERRGKKVYPQPRVLDIIRDKRKQKAFYLEHKIPTAPYQNYDAPQAVLDSIRSQSLQLPFVQKAATGGYDGRGVQVVRSHQQLDQLLPGHCLVESMVPIEKELAVVVARRPNGQMAAFPCVEMVFHPTANLVEWLACPARIPADVEEKAKALAIRVAEAFDIVGLLAVELFWTKSGDLLVNEVAPRPHNSGHHTQNSAETCQFEQHLRAILDLPLGSTRVHSPCVMLNLLGEDGSTGPARYQGLEEALQMGGVHLHLYGKATSKPYRKMGHINVVGTELDAAEAQARKVREVLKVVGD